MLSLTRSIRQSWFSTLSAGTLFGLGFGFLAPGPAQAGFVPSSDLDVAVAEIECEDTGGPIDVINSGDIEEPHDCMGLCMSECQMDCNEICADAPDVGVCRCECAHTCPDVCEDECANDLDILYDPQPVDPGVDERSCSVVDASNVGTTTAFAVLGLFAIWGLRRKRD